LPTTRIRAAHLAALAPGLWLSLPVLAITSGVWFAGISQPGIYLLIVTAALSLPWSLLGGFVVWLAMAGLAEATRLDPVAELYWGVSGSAILGAHLNGYLLFARRRPPPTPGTPDSPP